ncbi:hypothetical protein [Pedobacter sp. L105]|uniref:hypothetical protein n=1 Tax=Pedobacter sp. L105 TaxID=1641871 RepID=UPI00131CCF12|nr:hypothetical protein [Pedobacter sp. L105]
MNGLSPWALSATNIFENDELIPLFTKSVSGLIFNIYNERDSLFILASLPNGGEFLFRAAFTPIGEIKISKFNKSPDGITFYLTAEIGEIQIDISFLKQTVPVLRYITTLKPITDLFIPFWPRDVIVPGKNDNTRQKTGKIHASQVGTRSGIIYCSSSKPKSGSIFYLQNLTALESYCQQTQTSCSGVVGGDWPEMGFALPPTTDKALSAGKNVIIGDAIVAFDLEVPENEGAMVKQFLNLLAEAYLALPKPGTKYNHWPEILEKGLKDLQENPGCWSQLGGHSYLNAYVSDYRTPPEIMVQLAVLLPLLDYVEWTGSSLEIMKKIKEGLPSFFDQKLKTIMRWHPAAAKDLKGEEEQKQPLVMDSWYLHHPLLNLSRLALKGDNEAKKLFLDSIGFAIKVAHKFNYEWPVFYKMDTLDIVKAETQPGKGGEKDVPGLYAHVMLQAWEITHEDKYLKEAEKAAKKLEGLGFDLFYQANNTAFSAGALLRLFKITENKLYLDLSYICLANVFKNVQLWDCNYGYGKNYPTFFAIFPLSDAPYTAAYEEQEVFCALHDYLNHAQGVDILPSITLLIAEFIRYMNERAVFYYPPMLPEEMLSKEVKTGEVDANLWIALEDLHDGWEMSGEVGQEVYGAGNAFGILPRHYLKVPGEEFMVYVDYPINRVQFHRDKSLSFKTGGSDKLSCRMIFVGLKSERTMAFQVKVDRQKKVLKGENMKDGHVAYQLQGNQSVKLSWKKL